MNIPIFLLCIVLSACAPAIASATQKACDVDAPATMDVAPSGYRATDAMASQSSARLNVKPKKDECELRIESFGTEPIGEVMLGGPGAEPLRTRLALTGSGSKLYLWANANPAQWVEPGSYTKVLRFEVGPPGGPFLVREMLLTANVLPTVRVSIAGTGGSGIIDFGQMYTDQRAGLRVDVDANTSYDAVLRSDNGGSLRHSSDPASRVPYRIQVDGVELSGGRTFGWSGRNRTAHLLEVVIGSVQKALAGSYDDRWVLTVTAR
jgi:hypothetical protein